MEWRRGTRQGREKDVKQGEKETGRREEVHKRKTVLCRDSKYYPGASTRSGGHVEGVEGVDTGWTSAKPALRCPLLKQSPEGVCDKPKALSLPGITSHLSTHVKSQS